MFFLRISILLSLFTSIFLFSNTVYAKISAEVYGALPDVSLTSISPSGGLIGFRKNDADKDLYIVYSVKENKLVSAIDIGSVNPNDAYFLLENKIVFVVSARRKVLGYVGEHNFSAAYLYDIRTKKFQQMLVSGEVVSVQLGLGDIVGLSAGKQYAYMPAFVGDNPNDSSPNYSLLRVNLNKDRKPRVVEKGTESTIGYFVDKQGELIAREDYNNRKNTHTVLVRNGKKWRKIYEQTGEMRTISPSGVSPDGKSLVIWKQQGSGKRKAYFSMSLDDGAITGPIFHRDDADVESLITDVQRTVLGVRYAGFHPKYEVFDKNLQSKLDQILSSNPNYSVYLHGWTPDWKHILVYLEGPLSSGDHFIFTRGEAGIESQHIASARPGIPGESVHTVVKTKFPARDGLTIPTLLTVPKGITGKIKNLPAVVLPHGGPRSYDTAGFDWIAQFLSEQGYLVIQPQFRGSLGFGITHEVEGNGEWGKKMQDDITDAVNHYAKAGMLDPNRVCILGASYGGYAALAGVTMTPDTFKCAVSINGVSDLHLMLKDERSDHGKNHWVVEYWERSVSSGETKKETLKKISPAYLADKVKVPVLLIHSDKDDVVDINQSKRMKKKLKKSGKAVKFVKLKGDDHYLIHAESRVKLLKEVETFLSENLK